MLLVLQDGPTSDPEGRKSTAGEAPMAGLGLHRPRHHRAEGFGQLQGQSRVTLCYVSPRLLSMQGILVGHSEPDTYFEPC